MNNYLAHYGVMGMKWGVRRYQNKDGSLTPAGKKRAKRIESSRKEGVDYANKLAADRKKGMSAANALVSAQRKAKETGIVDSDFLNNPNISQKAKNKVTNLAKEHDAKTQTRDKARQEKVSNAVKTFKEKAKEHDAKTQTRDKARQEKVSNAVNKMQFSEERKAAKVSGFKKVARISARAAASVASVYAVDTALLKLGGITPGNAVVRGVKWTAAYHILKEAGF